jgi:type IV pilus assembly protein PilQ
MLRNKSKIVKNSTKRNIIKMMMLLFCLVSLPHYTMAIEAVSLTDTKSTFQPNDKVAVEFDFTGTAPQASSFVIQAPEPSIVVDFPSSNSALKQSNKLVDMGIVSGINVVEADGRTRAVIELKKELTKKDYTITRLPNNKGVVVTVKSVVFDKTPQGVLYSSSKPPVPQPYAIRGVDFRRSEGGGGKFVIKLSSPNVNVNVQEKGGVVTADFMQTFLPNRLQRRLDVTDFATPVRNIDLNMRGPVAEVRMYSKPPYHHLAYQMGDVFIIEVRPLTDDQRRDLEKSHNVYSGQRISLNFQDIKVRAVLQLLAEFTGLNIITSDSVKGSVTLRLKSVPWDQAMDIILKSQGLTQRNYGNNIVMIGPSDEITTREKAELQSEQAVDELQPLHQELIQLNYAKADDMAKLLKSEDVSLLSDRGGVSVDTRTNSMWVQDIQQRLEQVREFVKKLDVPVRQVLIKERIINVQAQDEKDLGIAWGITRPPDIMGTGTGANIMRNLSTMDPVTIANTSSGVPYTQRLNLDLPASSVGTAGGAASLGVALARLGGNVFLDMEISALETEGNAEIIASPSVITSNQQQASIEQGVEIPYQQASSSGATSVSFKKAVLSLTVTPQITPDDKVILTLAVNQDTVGQIFNGVPSIDTRKVQSQVLVNSGETIVIGGVYEDTKQSTITRIPFFGNLPVVGRFFRHTDFKDQRHELLIFITPKIIKDSLMAAEEQQ